MVILVIITRIIILIIRVTATYRAVTVCQALC